MTKDEMLYQLRDLIEDRESTLCGDNDFDDITKLDIEALEMAIDLLDDKKDKDECEGCEFFTDTGCAPDEYDFSDDYCLDDDIEMEMTGND
ncbi:MAG: hypothetical protein IIY21_16850 [Clostridiales bacterium]|nr:hypothetical protein [Clostridiales bacterium]MBQ1431950.1 hypothetical protein [Ruminococcus sp.]MBQ1574139.1 hypothetical protein [Clostridiales bacterium]